MFVLKLMFLKVMFYSEIKRKVSSNKDKAGQHRPLKAVTIHLWFLRLRQARRYFHLAEPPVRGMKLPFPGQHWMLRRRKGVRAEWGRGMKKTQVWRKRQ